MQATTTGVPRLLVLALAGVLTIFGLSACDSGGGPGSDGTLEIGFQTTNPSVTSSSAAVLKNSHDSFVIEGNNGRLEITDIRFIVEEFQLDGDEDSLDLNAPPAFLQLPLDTTQFATAGSFDVPPGSYFEFEFEVDDLEPDEDDTAQERQQIQELLNQIREDFPNFPTDASMIVIGTFTPTDGNPQDFTSYLKTEIEVEREFSEQNPLEVTGEGLSRSLTVRMDPNVWFRKSNGDVRNLAQWQSTDDLLEISEEFEDGVVEIEIDGD